MAHISDVQRWKVQILQKKKFIYWMVCYIKDLPGDGKICQFKPLQISLLNLMKFINKIGNGSQWLKIMKLKTEISLLTRIYFFFC